MDPSPCPQCGGVGERRFSVPTVDCYSFGKAIYSGTTGYGGSAGKSYRAPQENRVRRDRLEDKRERQAKAAQRHEEMTADLAASR